MTPYGSPFVESSVWQNLQWTVHISLYNGLNIYGNFILRYEILCSPGKYTNKFYKVGNFKEKTYFPTCTIESCYFFFHLHKREKREDEKRKFNNISIYCWKYIYQRIVPKWNYSLFFLRSSVLHKSVHKDIRKYLAVWNKQFPLFFLHFLSKLCSFLPFLHPGNLRTCILLRRKRYHLNFINTYNFLS